MHRPAFIVCAALVCFLSAPAQNAAMLSPVVPQVLPPEPGSGTLALGTTDLGLPIAGVWLPSFDWDQTGAITIELAVTSLPGDASTPVLHTVLLTANNSTTDIWDRFELEVAGAASFSLVALTTIDRAADPPNVEDETITFQGFDQGTGVWDSSAFAPTIMFGLDVVPPTTEDPVVLLTLRPVPEPGTGVVFVFAAAMVYCRRRRRSHF